MAQVKGQWEGLTNAVVINADDLDPQRILAKLEDRHSNPLGRFILGRAMLYLRIAAGNSGFARLTRPGYSTMGFDPLEDEKL